MQNAENKKVVTLKDTKNVKILSIIGIITLLFLNILSESVVGKCLYTACLVKMPNKNIL